MLGLPPALSGYNQLGGTESGRALKDLELRGLGFRVSGFGFWGLGFRASGFGFWVAGLGLRGFGIRA